MSNLSVKNIVNPTTADTTPTENLSKQVCRAWVNFNGTGTVAIRDSFNVSSITDNGVGNYTVNFAQAMNNANYSTSVNAGAETETLNLNPTLLVDRLVTSARADIEAANGDQFDAAVVDIQVFGS